MPADQAKDGQRSNEYLFGRQNPATEHTILLTVFILHLAKTLRRGISCAYNVMIRSRKAKNDRRLAY